MEVDHAAGARPHRVDDRLAGVSGDCCCCTLIGSVDARQWASRIGGECLLVGKKCSEGGDCRFGK